MQERDGDDSNSCSKAVVIQETPELYLNLQLLVNENRRMNNLSTYLSKRDEAGWDKASDFTERKTRGKREGNGKAPSESIERASGWRGGGGGFLRKRSRTDEAESEDGDGEDLGEHCC